MESAYSNDDLKGNKYLLKILAEFTKNVLEVICFVVRISLKNFDLY